MRITLKLSFDFINVIIVLLLSYMPMALWAIADILIIVLKKVIVKLFVFSVLTILYLSFIYGFYKFRFYILLNNLKWLVMRVVLLSMQKLK